MAKRGNGEGSIYPTKDGRWRVTISLGVVNGVRKRITRVCRRQADAIAMRELLRREAGNAHAVKSQLTLGQWLDQWLAAGKASWAGNTWDSYDLHKRHWIVPRIGGVFLTQLNAVQIRKLLQDCEQAGAKTRTLQLVRETLVNALNVAVEDGLITGSPALAVKKPKAKKRPDIFPFTELEVQQLLEVSAGTRIHLAVALGCLMGLRIGEILGLRKRCVDLAAGTLTVDAQVVDRRGRVALCDPKTATSRRTLDMPATVIAAFRSHAAIMLKEGNAGSEMVIPGAKSKLMRRTNLGCRRWKSLLKAAGVKHRGFHHTRHTFATHALRRGVALHVVSAVLGHSSPEVTLRTYAHLLRGDLKSAATAMDSMAVSGGSSVAHQPTGGLPQVQSG